MAFTAGSERQKTRTPEGEEYYRRITPDAYTITRGDGRTVGEIHVFDDRETDYATGVHIQFRANGGRRVASFHCEDEDNVEDVILALKQAWAKL